MKGPGEHLDEVLFDYVLGSLAEADRAAVREHLGSCARCRAEADAAALELGVAALAVEPVPPSPALKERLLASLGSENRFSSFVEEVASLCDLAREKAAALLSAIDDAAQWMLGPAEGVSLFHIDGGPRVASAIVGFVRIEPGASFPPHSHVGDEVVLLLQGSYVEPDGTVRRRGERVESRAGTAHTFTALPGPPLVYLVVVDQGISFDGGDVVGPGDPRM